MKRITFLLALAMVVGVAYAAEPPVHSVNVVGYANIPQPPGLDMKSSVFNVSSGTNTIQEILGTNGTANADETLADNVYIYTGSGYKVIWLYAGAGDPSLHLKWVDPDIGGPSTDVFLPGQGFFVLNRSTTTNYYQQVGDAVDEDEINMVIVPGLQIMAYPYSADVTVDKLACTNGNASADETLADNIYLKTDSGYKLLWLYSEPGDPSLHRKWVDPDLGAVSTELLPAGDAFWYRSRSTTNVTWTENRPYLND